MGVYDGSFNTRFNLAVQGKVGRCRRGSRGGRVLPLSAFNVPLPPARKAEQCVKAPTTVRSSG